MRQEDTKNPNEMYQSNKTAMSTVENSAYYSPHKYHAV